MDRRPEDAAETVSGSIVDPIERLLVECLDRADREGPAVFDAILTAHPDHSASLRERLESLRAMGLLCTRDDGAGANGSPPTLAAPCLGDFRLIRRLGHGATSVVWVAEQVSLGRLVAVKVLAGLHALSAAAVTRFRREAHAVAKLRHPNIVTVFATGETDGAGWLAMELVEGRGFDDLLRDARESGTPLPADRVARIGRDIARALAAAHDAGVVHRDVKPANIRITPDARAVLLDFGLARDEGGVTLTAAGEFQGSPLYASPEQVGRRGSVGPASDVYSLGVTLYEGATGRPAYRGETIEQVFQQILSHEPRAPRAVDPRVPRDLDTVIQTAIQKDPARRYASAAEFANDLAAVLELRPIRARPPGAFGRTWRWARRNRELAAAVGLALVLALALPLTLLVRSVAERTERESQAADALREARARLDGYRRLRQGVADLEREREELRFKMEHGHTSVEQDQHREVVERELIVRGRARDEVFPEVLQLLQRAGQLDRNLSEPVRIARADLFLEKWREANSGRDARGVELYRGLVEANDPDGRRRAEVSGTSRLELVSEPPGATVWLFRCADLRTIDPMAASRLVPVPFRREPANDDARSPVRPGAFVLRVFARREPLHAEDLIVAIDGEAIGPESFVAEGAVARIAAKAARGGCRATVVRAGEPFAVELPEGLDLRATAAPLLLGPEALAGTTPLSLDLAAGDYVALLRADGHEDLRLPFWMQIGGRTTARAALLAAGTSPPGFVRIPTFDWHSPEAPKGSPVEGFWLKEREVTCAEYLAFLADRYPSPAQAPAGFAPRDVHGPDFAPWQRNSAGDWTLPDGVHGDWPVTGITWEAADAYAQWRTAAERARDGRFRFALPNLEQWQAAGRAPEGRRFPFGDEFRAKWIKSCYARPSPRLEPVLAFPLDESAFGVHDMAGSAREFLADWFYKPTGEHVVVGGSYADPQERLFAVSTAEGLPAKAAPTHVGFRLAARIEGDGR